MTPSSPALSKILVAGVAASCFFGWWLHDAAVMVHGGWLPYLAKTLPTSLLQLVLWVCAAILVSRNKIAILGLTLFGIALTVAPKLITTLGLPLPTSTVTASAPKALTALGLALAFVLLADKRKHLPPSRVLVAGLGAGSAAAAGLFLARTGNAVTVLSNLPSILTLALGLLALGSFLSTRSRWSSFLTAATGLAAIGFLVNAVAWEAEHRRLPRPDQAQLPQPGDARPIGGKPPNLVLITLDTVTVRHLRTHGYSRSTMPNLEDFVARRAINYLDARSSAPWTLPSHATLFTGLSSAEHGVTSVGMLNYRPTSNQPKATHPLNRTVETLAEMLTGAGYQSGAIVANSPVLHPATGIDRGFERYDGRAPILLPVPQGLLFHMFGRFAAIGSKPYYEARQITRRSLRWLRSRDERPFFLFINYLDAHIPLIPEDRVRRAFDSAQPNNQPHPKRELLPLLYDRELLHLDRHLGTLLHSLEQRPDFDNTLIVITSDHGESFGAHDFWGHAIVLYEEVLHVPLFVKAAGNPPPRSIQRQFDGVSTHPLILNLLGITRPKHAITRPMAESYRSHVQTEPMPPHLPPGDRIAWLQDHRKVIVNSNGLVEVFDLAQDPQELNNLVNESQRLHYLAQAKAWWDQHPRPERAPLPNPAPDPEAVKRLRALGYLGGQ